MFDYLPVPPNRWRDFDESTGYMCYVPREPPNDYYHVDEPSYMPPMVRWAAARAACGGWQELSKDHGKAGRYMEAAAAEHNAFVCIAWGSVGLRLQVAAMEKERRGLMEAQKG